MISKKKKKKKKKKGLRQNSEWFFGQNPKFKRFFRPKLGDLQKKKKGLRQNSGRFFFQNFASSNVWGGLFSYGGGYFPFFTENRPQKHKKHAILHTSQPNGGARAPPAPPPWLRYCIRCNPSLCKDFLKKFHQFNVGQILSRYWLISSASKAKPQLKSFIILAVIHRSV